MMHSPQTLSVRVFHEDPVMSAGLVAVLERHAGIAVRATAVSAGRDDVDPREDVVVADYDSGLDCLRAHRAGGPRPLRPPPRVLVVTHRARESEVRHALDVGVRGYVLQGCSIDELVAGVRMLSLGAHYLGEVITQRIAESLTRVTLTGRETQVLGLLSQGHGNKTIARSLGIAPSTVKAHVKAILEKLGASTRTQAVTVAAQRGLIGQVEATNAASPAPRRRSGHPAASAIAGVCP